MKQRLRRKEEGSREEGDEDEEGKRWRQKGIQKSTKKEKRKKRKMLAQEREKGKGG